MRHRSRAYIPLCATLVFAVAAASCGRGDRGGEAPAATTRSAQLHVPVRYDTLDNGLRVALSPDPTAPVVTVAVYYHIGFRIEPRGRTGFAHLFEHMMFQGSRNLGKMQFVRLVQRNGGVFNGSTRFDFTNYFETVPANKLETMLWAEADRMRGLDVSQANLDNQRSVVKNEVRVNVLNRPYGGFPWLDLPQYANRNWHNAHNFYGDMNDLDAATLADVRAFFSRYYTPNNAALVVVGDFDPDTAMAWVRRYFGDIPRGPALEPPDASEPAQTAERRVTKVDSLASRPALAVGYHMPPRGSPEYYAMGLIDQVLLQGDDAWLHQALVQDHGYTGSVNGGINLLGNMFDYDGPMLWTLYLFHDSSHSADGILATVDSLLERIRTQPLDSATLRRALVKRRSRLYDQIENSRDNLLASFALFDDDPARINTLAAEFERVTPALIQKTAQQYLRPTNRTILLIQPAARSTASAAGATARRGGEEARP